MNLQKLVLMGEALQGAHTRSVYKCALVKRSVATFSVGDRKKQKRKVIHISMKMIHLNAKIISRGGEKPQSAVASAVYRSRTKIYCEYGGEIKDFSRKGHVIYSEILLPEYAPKEFADRSVLWNAVENFEKGSRAQLSREIEFSLPCELDADERLKAAKKLAEFFRDKGMVVDMNLHNPDHENPNPHCHLMLTMRPFQKDGTFLEKKCWREYELDKNGQKIPTKKGNDYKSHKVYATDWDDKGNVVKWRALWADIETDFYRKSGYEITAEHRSFERQGIDLLPTIHMGAAVTAMERSRQIKSAGLQDNTFFDYTFANCDEMHPCVQYARRYVGNFAEFQKNGQGLLFWGNVGTGKTFLAGCIDNALMEKNIPVLMTSFPKLLNALGGLYSGEKNEYLKSLNQYRLLIIDDLGVERDTSYVLETVYLVIDERYKSGKSFIITTNLSLEELRNPADLEHERIYDRIMERCVPVAFSGKNYRIGRGRANMENASGILKHETV